MDAATAVEAPDDVADEQCSRVEGGVGEEPDPASGGDGAA
jgi:hypothetical protein